MKKIISPLLLLFIGLSVFSSSCKKDGGEEPPPPGPDVTLPTSGLLCTRTNYLRPGGYDTIKYRSVTTGDVMIGIGDTRISQDGERVFVVINGDNTVSIKLEKPLRSGGRDYYYFRTQVNSSPVASVFPLNAYLFNWSETATSETKFIINRSAANKLKFTLESKAYPGYFLGTARWKNSLAENDDSLIFSSKKQEFFFKAN
jgi:hypothetical protein